MVQIVAGLAAAGVVLLLAGCLALRVREVFFRDSVWATLWSRGPWKAEPVVLPADAPDLLRLFVRSFSATEAETVAEVRFSVSGVRLPGAGPAGAYLAVLAFPTGAVLRWRSEGTPVSRSGFTWLDGDRLVTREWAFGLVPTAWCTATAVDNTAAETTLLATALSVCWAPAAIVRTSNARWSVGGPTALSVTFPDLPHAPAASIGFSPDGRPAELSVTAGSERAALRVTMSDFAEFDGYCLPRRLEAEGVGFAITLDSLRYSGPWTDRLRT